MLGKARRTINLRGFQTFEAVARHLSVTAAADEIGVSQSAVSHQLRTLSRRIGENLVERQGRSIRLTATGERLARSLHRAFDIMEEQHDFLDSGRAMLRVGLYSSFALGWLIHRLPSFVEANPGIDVRLSMLGDPHEVSMSVADVFITSEPLPAGYWSTSLFDERLVPVIRADGPHDFSYPLPLISAEVEPGIAGRAWQAFCALNELDMMLVRDGDWLCCSHYILALEMALHGMGAALLPDFLVKKPLEDGRLRQLPGRALPTGQSYDVQVQFERRLEPAIVTVLNWITQEAS